MAKVRRVNPEDAAALIELYKKLDLETNFMLLEPGERNLDVDHQRKRIEERLAENNSTLFVTARDADLVGFIAATGGGLRRNRYTADVAVGVLQAFSGQGIAARLFEALETWAEERGLRRLELTVMAHNERAIRLCEKLGYELEGTRRDALRIDGVFVDEQYRAKLI